MKRPILAVLCLLILCSLGIMTKTSIVEAYKAGYEVNDYVAIKTPTMDGKWTADDEWTDAEEKQLDGSLNVIFRLKYVTGYPDWVNQYYLIEFFDDATNDTGDYWQICYATATTFFGNPAGGKTPQKDCFRIDFVGHTKAGLAVYQGDGNSWTLYTDYTWPTHIEVVNTISPSPLNSTPHWIAEIKIEHIHFGIQPYMWIRVAAYDASKAALGVQSWPSGSQDAPDDWGLLNALQTTIPENLNIVIAILASTLSVLVVPRCLMKTLRTKRPPILKCNTR